jgi:uncharacterized membrane protein
LFAATARLILTGFLTKNTTSVSVKSIFKLINARQCSLKEVQYVVIPLNLLGAETELSRTGNSLATFLLLILHLRKKKTVLLQASSRLSRRLLACVPTPPTVSSR